MKAAILSEPDAAKPDYAAAEIKGIPTPEVVKGDDVQVKIHAAALNHRGAFRRVSGAPMLFNRAN